MFHFAIYNPYYEDPKIQLGIYAPCLVEIDSI